jgi:hypothetical protein
MAKLGGDRKAPRVAEVIVFVALAQALGLAVPHELLIRADEVIE